MAANGTLPAPPGLSEGPPPHELVRDAVLRDIETKVTEKMEELWAKGRQMLAQVHQKQQEKTDQLLTQIQQCKEQQEVLERENQSLKQVLTKMASHLSQLGLEKPSGGLPPCLGAYSSPPTTAAGSVTTTPQRSAEGCTPPIDAVHTEAGSTASPPEVPAFPAPLTSPAAPLSLAEALNASGPATPLSLAKTLAEVTPATASTWAPQVFSMTLRKADGAELGLNVKALDSQKAVLVEGIRPDGAVEAWNRQCVGSAHPERAILAGDRIISVNGISYEPEKMLEECRDKQLLKLTLLRGDLGELAASSLTMRAEASEFVPKGGEPSL